MTPRPNGRAPRLPRTAEALLRALLPAAERDEVLADLRDEFEERTAERGRPAARRWLWRQVTASLPSLLRRSWWRGWTGWEPRANRMQPGGWAMESWIMDARFALRRLRSRPTYALLAVLTLALGVGGTAAIFSIVRGLLLEPLPYEREEEVAVFWHEFSWSEAEFSFLRENFPGFAEVAAYRPEDVTLRQGDAPPRLVPGMAATVELFRVLGVQPVVGTGFREGDDLEGAEPTAVISYGLWEELGGDPSIIGQAVRLDGVERTVTGVMPRGFWFPDPSVRVWLAEPLSPTNRSGMYTFVGRLAPGQTFEAMDGPLARIAAALKERFDYPDPKWDPTLSPSLTPVREHLIGSVRPSLLATLGAMAVILLIACANVAALMLGQVDSRSTELAVRTALGAERGRLVRQLTVEAVVVGLLAGVVGALLASAGFRLLVEALPLGELAEGASLDWSVFAASIAIAVAAALVVAIAPTFSLWRGDLGGALRQGRTAGIGGRGGRLESGLVVGEVALAVVMAAGAALLIRSVANLHGIDPGLETRGVAVVDVALPADLEREERARVLRELVPELEALPGVRSVAAVQKLPLTGGGDNWGMEVPGRPELGSTTTAFRIVTPAYFETMGIELRQGRGLSSTDPLDEERVVVINEALAAEYFPGVDPIGRQLVTGFGDTAERIVGVVGNVAEGNLTDEREPARYMLYDEVPYTPETNTLVLKVDRERDAAAVLEAARRTIHRAAPGVAVQNATTMEQVFSRAVGPARQVMTLLTLLGGLALVLGAVGVYGVVSHFVSRRKRDWGIRIALGMQPAKVIAQIVRRGSMLVVAGIAAGTIAFLVLARLLTSFLYEVGAADPVALAAAAAVLLGAGLLAAFIPARRASRIDPALALREQ